MVSRKELRGEFAMLWNPEVTVKIKSFSKHHMDDIV